MAEQIGLSAVFEMGNFNSGISKYTSGLDKATSATDRAGSSMGKAWGNLGSSVTKTTAILGGAVVGAAALAGAAIAKFTGDGISKAIDLDQKLADIAATLNMTKDEIAPLNDLILQLGLDPNLKVNAEEAAAAIEMLARNGLDMTEIMGGAAKATVLLANATGAEFGTAADIATDAMAIFKIDAADMIDAVNGIVSVTTSSKFTMNDYALAIAQGGAVAANAGVSFDDFNTTIAAISPNFASGSDAGTSFKSFMNSLTPSTEKATATMKELGLMTADGANQFYDAAGNMKDMNEVSVLLNQALSGLTEQQRALALETLFGTDGSRAAIGLMEAGKVVYTDLATAVKETGLAQGVLTEFMKDGELTAFELTQAQQSLTDANAQAATRMDTVAGAMEIFSGVVETLQIQIGQAFLPVIRQMVDMFTAFVSTHSPAIVAAFQKFAENIVMLVNLVILLVENGGNINDWLTNMDPALGTVALSLAGLVLGIQQAGEWIGSTIGQFVSWNDVLIVVGAAIATVVIPAIVGMIAAMAPAIGMFALAVGAVAAVRIAWESDFLGIQTTVTNAINAIIEAFAPLTSAITEFGTGALAEIKAFATGNATEFTNLKAVWEGAKESVNNLFTSIVGSVRTNLPTWTSSLKEWGLAAVQWIIDAHAQALTAIAQFITAIISFVSSRLPTWIATFTEWTTAAWQWIVDAIAEVGPKIAQWFTALVGAVSSRLPAWKTAFVEWATAMGAWIAESTANLADNINQWFASLQGGVSSKLPSFKSSMLQFATALVEWIGSSAADALPKLGAWLGKLIAWIPLGALALAKALVQMASALVGWIAGGEGSSGETAVSKADPAMAEFQKVLIDALKKVGVAFVAAGQAFVTEFATTLTGAADWNQVGQEILNSVRTGFESVRDAVYNSVTLLVQRVVDFFLETDWEQLGADIMDAVRAGVESMTSAIVQAVKDIVEEMKQKFRESISAFTSLGKDIIAGVLRGLKENGQAVIDYLTGLISDALGGVTSLLGIESPSKVFAEIGKNMILGLITGMESMKSHLKSSVSGIVSGLVAGVAGNMLAGSRNMLTEFGKLAGDFTSAAGDWSDAVQALTGDGTEDNPAQAALNMLGAQQGVTANLQRQLKIVELLRAAGRDPAQFLGAGGALGRNADPVYLMNLLAQAAEDFNNQLENQLRIAAKGYDTLINDLRSERQEMAAIEDLALRPSLRGIDFIRSQIRDLDSQIAESEQNLLNTGHSIHAEQLRQLHIMRQMRASELNDYIKLWNQVESTVEQAATFAESLTNEKGAEAARRFVDNHIRPLLDMIQTPGASMDQRKVWAAQINERMEALVQYERSLRILTTLQERFDAITGDSNFGATIAKNIQPFLDVLYDPMLTGADRNKLFNTLSTYQARIAGLLSTFNRLGSHSAFGNLGDLLTPYLNKLLDVNLAEDERNKITAEYMRINQRLQTAQVLDNATISLNERLDLLNKIKALSGEMGSDSVLKYIIGDVDLMKGLSPEQFAQVYQRYSEQAVAAASKALREALMPDLTKEFNKVVGSLRSFDQIMKDFDQSSIGDLERAQQYLGYYDAEIERLRALAAAGHQQALEQAKLTMANRDKTVAWIRTYMDALVKADRHVARIQATTDERAADIAETFRENLIDPLVELMQKNIGADYRAILVTQIGQRVDQLNSYVRQIGALSTLQKDLSDALGFNPLVARFAEMRLDPLLEQIYNINTAEAERLRLVQLYRQEQEKIVALNQKVQQLEFLNMQLSLLEQITQLNEEFGEQVPLSDILEGLQFGVNANMDQMLKFVGDSLDAILRVTKHKLGIASPSKVFAKIGAQMMQGMAAGIQSSIMQPLSAMRSAISDVPYAMQSRSLAINMGGVTINSGMDEVMFEAQMRQIVRNEFN